ncbi:MAG: hypothetical protein ACRD3D_13190 [Terriglobia bacterium]
MVVAPALGIQQRIEAQRLAAKFREFDLVGRLSVIVFDARGMNAPEREYDLVNGNMLDWEDRGPWLAVSKDQQDLLVAGTVPHPPELRDTSTYPPQLAPQRYSDRTQSKFGDFLVIQPVYQILYKPKGIADWKIIRVTTGFDGSQMAFLVDPELGEGHLIGGHFQL